ncbi:MAG: indole-3-glycerol phosphate synthase TrpC [Candidatus Kaelpia aquatica]|nr:indole-3-glycerol phosphate synthase TrpC [Candidatus Kaelpia aquatica]
MSLLNEILLAKKEQIRESKKRLPLAELREEVENKATSSSRFLKALKNDDPGIKIIAEIKRSSPSAGDILSSDADILELAKLYRMNGVSCISVLSEEKFFKGSLWDLKLIKESINLPVLRKDFIIDEYQVYESKYFMADAILLIARILEPGELSRFSDIAKSLGLDVLFEVHDVSDLDKVMGLNPDIIGVNNRDLESLAVSFASSEELIGWIPKEVFKISASGIKSHSDILYLKSLGVDGFLIGESILKVDDRAKYIRELLGYGKG